MWRRLRLQPSELPLEGDESARFLPWLIAVMVFLASLALAASLGIEGTAQRWDKALAGGATVQIPAGPEADRQVESALQLLRKLPGIIQAQGLTRDAAAALVAPWLGEAARLPDLPVPRIIEVTYDPQQLDSAALRQQLTAAVPGASFDDHQRWVAGLRAISHAAVLVGLGIFALVALVATVAVIFTTRTGLAVHQDVIEVLHLIGAQDRYIANGFAYHAWWTGLRGGLFGAVLAAASLLLLTIGATRLAPGLLPAVTFTLVDWLLLAALPPAAGLLAAATARLTVMRALSRLP
jgi:cell division transport system permease protein